MGSTGDTEVRITLPHRQETWTLLSIAGSLASTTREAVLTVWAAVTKLFTEVLSHYTSTVLVTGLVWVVTRGVVVHMVT